MALKGLDYTFVHHGIRHDDLQILETIAQQYEIDGEWLKNFDPYFTSKN